LLVRITSRISIFLVTSLLALSLHAQVDIELTGVSGEIEDNLLAHFSTLEAPTNPLQQEAFYEKVISSVDEAVQVFGYYNASVEVTPKDQDDDLSWIVDITLGTASKITKLELGLLGNGQQDAILQKIVAESKLKLNEAIFHPDYEATKNRLRSTALARGYFDFKFSKNAIIVDQENNQVEVNLVADTGSRYSFGEVIISKDHPADFLIRSLIPFKQGQPYLANSLSNLTQLLKRTGYFKYVVVRPLLSDASENQVPIEVIVTSNARDKFDLGAGVSSDKGPRFIFKWQRPWVNKYGHSIRTNLFVSKPEQKATFTYKVPLEDAIKNYASVQVGWQGIDDNDTNSDKFTIALQRHWSEEHSDWDKIGFVRYEKENYQQGSADNQRSELVLGGATLTRLRSNGGIDISWGDKQTFTLEAGSEDLLSDINIVRFTAQSKWLRSYGDHRILVRGDAGLIETSQFDLVPSSLRYFAGGDQSIRGFGYKALSPLDEEGELIGAKYLTVGSAEYSYPVSDNWRAAVFADIGSASDTIGEDLASGLGIGAQWLSPVGPIRFYIARGQSDYENTWRFHFSMGPTL
jgi:translocation and assembly module TamA